VLVFLSHHPFILEFIYALDMAADVNNIYF
jgi:hypothetical protein